MTAVETRAAAVDVPSGRLAALETPRPGDPRLARFSLNQATTKHIGLAEAVEVCARAGVPAIGVWRDRLHEVGLDAAVRLVRGAGLRVSSLCRGGFLTADDADGRAAALHDNRLAIDEAAALGADCLVMVVGGLPAGSRDLPAARRRVVDAVGELAPYAGERGVRLALEPLHPMYVADRAVLSTLGQALDVAEQFPVEQVGVVVDTFHVFWDPELERQIARAGERIASYQVCDWITPLPADTLLARGMMGDGHIDFPAISRAVHAAGYRGDVETEIFHADVWAADPDEVVATVLRRYVEHVLVG
ncbi:sugar phosphate isomerase/epimerase [Kineococcus xinjiangensis]|uniref:Sugar phosphate isomerase/epimerase n=1 Tax=Kineococcus xinjiangensis TaxID=512762 RepID=A0A2S6ISI6_9ACTN|nr:sugar phosphate isomerase/epimerase family protein [Kineococcus xinjiangensis]PPK97209.1 sugar phosphate isomerase/epimerase [Kineococcus xinjiangensis]